MSRTYENLEAWQFAVKLVVKVYQITQDFPKEEFYGLTSQIRRAAISVSSNIAEGAGRSSKKEFKYFIDVAKGSLNETENLWIISRELKFFKDDKFQEIKI